MSDNLPNFCYVNIASGCTEFTVCSLDSTEDYGKSFILSNNTTQSVTINSSYLSSFSGLVGDVSSFSLSPYGKAIIVNNSICHDVISLQSGYYDWKPGVYMLGGTGNFLLPYSCIDLRNVFSQPYTSSLISNDDRQDIVQSISGYYSVINKNDNDNDGFLIYPNWGLVVYEHINYYGTILLNYKNKTNNPVCVKSSIANTASSIKIYYFDKMIEYL